LDISRRLHLLGDSTLPAGNSTARQCQRMVIKQSEDGGLNYLYYMRSNDTPFFRSLIFY
jgi:hypothetical protein